jgi:hypothetical protein
MPRLMEDDVFDRPVYHRRRNTPPGTTFGSTFSPTGSDSTGNNDPFNQFDDPATHHLESIIQQQLAKLSRPMADPTTDGIMAFLKGQLGSLSSAPPIAFDFGGDFTASNPLFDDFVTQGRQRIAELNQRPFTDAEEAALKTRTRQDQVVARDEAKKRVLLDAARRGVGESSGVLQEGLQGAEQSFTAADAKSQNDLMLWIADQMQQRKNQATGIAQSLASAGEARASREQAGRIAGGQMKMQGQIAANSANQARQGMVLGIAGSLAEMAAQQRGEQRVRQQDVLALSTLLAELPMQRLQMMMSVLNGTGGNNIPNLFSNVSQLNAAQEAARARGDAASASFLEGLAKLASYYSNRTT